MCTGELQSEVHRVYIYIRLLKTQFCFAFSVGYTSTYLQDSKNEICKKYEQHLTAKRKQDFIPHDKSESYSGNGK